MLLKSLPNLLSVLRLILVLPFVYFFQCQNFSIALSIFLFAALTDAMDGWLARILNCQTDFGLIIDPLADKLLIVACFMLLGYHHVIEPWLVILVFTRDIAISFGAFLSLVLFKNQHPLYPSLISKLNTCLQMLLIISSLMTLCWPIIPYWLFQSLSYIVGITTALSFIHYFGIWFKTFRLPQPQR